MKRDEPSLRLTFTGSTEDVDSLQKGLAAESYTFLEAPSPEKQKLALDVATAAAIVALVPVVLTDEPLLGVLSRLLGRKRHSRLVISSPLGTVTVESERELSDEEVRKMIRVLGGSL